MVNSTERIVIATSIAPVGIEKQQSAIQSWVDLGFKVVSLNIQSEIDKLQPLFTDVHFQLVHRDGRAMYGKPLVYIDDLLHYLSTCDTDVAGIVNSDIYIRAETNFPDFVKEQAKDSLFLASRVDIDNAGSTSGEIYAYGFDMFFFDTRQLKRFPSTDLCLGVPWWDYWVPLAALQMDLPIRYLKNTVAYHVKHKINYSVETWRRMGVWFTQQFSPKAAKKLQDLLVHQNVEQLDNELGPNITYSFIQTVYRHTKFIVYKPDKLNSGVDSKANQRGTVQPNNQGCESPLKLQLKKLQEDKRSYGDLIQLAWQDYKDCHFSQMIIKLQASLLISSQPRFATMSLWLSDFTQFASDEQIDFDAISFFDLTEWQGFIQGLLANPFTVDAYAELTR